MSTVTACIQIEASPKGVWQVAMDSQRLGEWVTIHRRLISSEEGPLRSGYRMHQQLQIRGVRLDVRWKLIDCQPAKLARWEGRGPARTKAQIEYRFERNGNGTQFTYRNDFHAPLGLLGAIAQRALAGGVPEREAHRSLERLKLLAESSG